MLCGCKSIEYSTENLPKSYLTVGSFGGFSGLAITTYILPNGQILVENSMQTKNAASKSVSKKEAKKLMKAAKNIKWNQLPPDNFGNMNYFIAYHSKDTTYKSQWSAENNNPPAALNELYQNIQKLIAE